MTRPLNPNEGMVQSGAYRNIGLEAQLDLCMSRPSKHGPHLYPQERSARAYCTEGPRVEAPAATSLGLLVLIVRMTVDSAPIP